MNLLKWGAKESSEGLDNTVTICSYAGAQLVRSPNPCRRPQNIALSPRPVAMPQNDPARASVPAGSFCICHQLMYMSILALDSLTTGTI